MWQIDLYSAKEEPEQPFGGRFSVDGKISVMQQSGTGYASRGCLIIKLKAERETHGVGSKPYKRKWREAYVCISIDEIPSFVQEITSKLAEVYDELEKSKLLDEDGEIKGGAAAQEAR